jgi:hypothetical protein
MAANNGQSTSSKSKNSKGKHKSKGIKTLRRSHRSRKTIHLAPKLEYMELPDDFTTITPSSLDQIVLFWSPIFKKNELYALKEKIHAMIAEDQKIKLDKTDVRQVWSVCQIVKELFPAYFISMKNKSYQGPGGYTRDQEVDFSNYQMACCTTMLLYGIISYRMLMHDQDYRLIFKGGKAVQMGINTEYDSQDIDIMIDPLYGYDPKMIDNISGHLALLIQWLLPFKVSVQPPGRNPTVYKVSYVSQYGSMRAFSDVDFKQVDVLDPFFKETYMSFPYIHELQEKAMFRRPTIEKVLEEKIFYYKKYESILKQLNEGIEVEGVNKGTCDFFMKKFGRAIMAINPKIDLSKL